MTISDIRDLSGLTRIEFSERYEIPIRTLEKWERGERSPAPYIINLLLRAVKEDYPE